MGLKVIHSKVPSSERIQQKNAFFVDTQETKAIITCYPIESSWPILTNKLCLTFIISKNWLEETMWITIKNKWVNIYYTKKIIKKLFRTLFAILAFSQFLYTIHIIKITCLPTWTERPGKCIRNFGDMTELILTKEKLFKFVKYFIMSCIQWLPESS